MEQVIDYIKKLREKADLLEKSGYATCGLVQDYRNCAEIIEKLSEQPQAVCSRREWYQKGYQDGLNADKWIPCNVKDIIDTIISHNEIVALWVEEETEDVRYDKRIWRGMAWEIPKQYMGCKFEKIFGTVPESIVEADTINIRIETPKPYKKEGA